MRCKLLIGILTLLLLISCGGKKTTSVSLYPEKFEGLTQLVLASETKTVVISDTTVRKLLFVKLGSATVKLTASITFDFYMDFKKDAYKISYSVQKDTLYFSPPKIRVKKPVINSTTVEYPEKSIFINEDHEALVKLQTITDDFIDEGIELSQKKYVKDKCFEMLSKYLKDFSKKSGYPVKRVIFK
jgi:hypothetical protein